MKKYNFYFIYWSLPTTDKLSHYTKYEKHAKEKSVLKKAMQVSISYHHILPLVIGYGKPLVKYLKDFEKFCGYSILFLYL